MFRHRHLRIARRTLGYIVAVALVLVALVLGVASQLLPLAERHPGHVAAWLSERAGRTVAFDRVRTDWTRRGPLLRLDNLRVGEGAEAFTVGDTEMLVSLYAGLLPGRPLSELRLRGLDLTLERADDGRWQVRGLPGQEQQEPGSDPFAALEGLGELQVIGGRLAVHAPALGIDARIPRIDLRLRVDGDRVRAGVRAWARPDAQPLDGVLDLDRRRGDGTVYAGATRARLAEWAPLLHLAGVSVADGSGRAQAWGTLRGYRVLRVDARADLRALALRGAALDGNVPRMTFDRVQLRARWARTADGWRLDAPRLRIDHAGRPQTLDGLMLAGGRRYALVADDVDAAPLVALAGLSDRIPPALRDWLRQARPQARLRSIELAGQQGGALRVQADVAGFGFEPIGTAPGLHGLTGRIRGDAQAVELQFDPQAAMEFDWPAGFGVTHPVRLQGRVVGWRDGAGWRVATPSLHIDGQGYAATARGGLWWQGDGSRPWIDLATRVDHATVPVAKGFWVRHLMPPAVVQWLDAALVGGRVLDGRAIAVGDLDDWPFTGRNGRFEANAHLAGATLKFQPDWPAAEDLDADVRFLGDGFSVQGRTRLGGVRVGRVQAGIDHYDGGDLTVQATAETDAAALLAVLRRSPLEAEHHDAMVGLDARGPTTATFALDLPLRPADPLRLGGTVELRGARLADSQWKLAFDEVRGQARYSQDGFGAEDLNVRHDGQPGRLSLRAGEAYVRERGHAFEGALDASLRAEDLLARAPDELAWLKPYVAGRSTWSVGIAIPAVPRGRTAPTVLQLRSNLVGTALTLPAPLSKPAGAALATSVDTPLPLGSGEVRVSLGQLAAVRARTGNGRTGVRVALGTGRVDEPPPASGLVASGRAAALDAIDWIALAHGGTSTAAAGADDGGLALQRIDVTARRLQLLGGVFPDTRVVVVPAPGGATAVRVEGASLQGALLVPAADGATVAGRFERVFWRTPDGVAAGPGRAGDAGDDARAPGGRPSAAVGSTPPATATADPGFDPARIPPLAFDVDELRIGDARLGSARLRTRSIAGGMRIEQLQARTPDQRLDMTGDWTGRGTAARTRLDATLASNDFGALLTGLGLGGRLGGGTGSLQLRAGWAGSPADFALPRVEGSLVLDARDGRLLEVEPGAGRVLGLLSLAELPRRLMLDFRDFFAKGFSFNHVAGTIRIDDGSARSDDLRIDGPAATIDIRGAANLRTQHFDQTIDVHPKAGNLLTAVGAIAGGPVGAAIGAAANAVLKKPLGQIGAKTYRVTGPWSEPKVEVSGREQGQVATDAHAPGG